MLRKFLNAAAPFVGQLVCAAACAAGLTNLWLDVPFVAQQKDGCGAACIAMVMQYWERHQGQPAQPQADSAQIYKSVYTRDAHGTYASAMLRYLQQNGYRAFAFAGQDADLERELAQGRPLIAALKPGPGSTLHYVVVAGLDQPDQLVLMNDPAQRKLVKEDESQFEREWQATGHWLLLAVPEPNAPNGPNGN
jgi:ABC-type bacteriocin/lantibiotic exporter with double-glycine peptidase domain